MSVDIVAGTDGGPGTRLLGRDLRVRRVLAETPEAVSIEFDPAPGLEYQAGQFLTVRVPLPGKAGGAIGRSYSLSSSPDADTAPKVTVKRVQGGRGSNWLCDNVSSGTVLRVLPPAGSFVLDPAGGASLFFAAGSGITPIISMLKSVLVRAEAPVLLFYANRDRESVIFRREIDELASRYSGRLTVIHWLTGERGRPSPGRLSTFIPQLAGDETAYICGPRPFTTITEEALAAAGLPASRTRSEAFVSMTGDPFAVADLNATEEEGAGTSVTVDLDGDVESFACPSASPILDAMLAAGLDPPYSCREGTCGTCMAQLTSGEVEHGSSLALGPDEEAEGYILPCQAFPRSVEISVEF